MAEQPEGPPLDEPAFQALPMFAGDANELFGSLQPQRYVQFSCGLRENVSMRGMGMLGAGGQTNASLGVNAMTSRGNFSAEAISQGVVQVAAEMSPLPIMQLSTQLAFMPFLCGGQASAVLMTPVGPMFGHANLMGQLSGEFLAGTQLSENSQVMVGVHGWGKPGTLGGLKTGIEYQHMVVQDEQLKGCSIISLICTAPRPQGETAAAAPSWSFTAFKKWTDNSVCASFDVPAGESPTLTAGGTRKIDESTRFKGTFNSKGVLALALEMAGTKNTPLVGEKAMVSLSCNVDTAPTKPLNPKVGATLQFSG